MQVSVRRGALSAATRLLEQNPSILAVAQLWVATVLALVCSFHGLMLLERMHADIETTCCR